MINLNSLLKRKILLPAGLILFFGIQTVAQTKTIADTSKKIDSVAVIEEKLVALALQGPQYKGSEHQNKINEYQLKRVKGAWLNLLTISGNYNEQSFKKQTGPVTTVYPKYFFGLSIPLGIIFSNGIEVKTAKESIAYSKSSQEQLGRNIRAEVLTKYRQYRAYEELINLEKEMIYDVQVSRDQAEQKFAKNSITIETYNAALKSYNDEKNKLINLVMQKDLIRIDIEKSIGMDLDEAIKLAFQK